jgi:hypothetical protein
MSHGRPARRGLKAGVLILLAFVIVAQTLLSRASETYEDYSITDKVLCPVVALFLGCALFAIRGEYRGLYGATEILIGLILAFTTRGKLLDSEDWTSLLVAVYIIVRGLDNCEASFKARTGLGFLKFMEGFQNRRALNRDAPNAGAGPDR